MRELWAQAWSFLNSKFGLLVLSSVVLASVTAKFNDWREAAARRAAVRETVRRLDTEIGGRLEEALVAMRVDSMRIARGVTWDPSGVYSDAWQYLDNAFHFAEARNDFSIFPDLSHRKFRSLVIELARSLQAADTTAIPDLRLAMAGYRELTDSGDVPHPVARGQRKAAALAAIQASQTIIKNRIFIRRWRTVL
jgi:hypothetical protein